MDESAFGMMFYPIAFVKICESANWVSDRSSILASLSFSRLTASSSGDVRFMSQEQNLGEQALGKVAEIAISSQLDQVEEVNVDVKTDPIKLMQGKVDSVSIAGEGMVMKQELRAAAVGIETESVAIDPMKAVLGEIELKEPLDANAQILLTEDDLNRALASDYLRNKMRQLEIIYQGSPTQVDIEQIELQLSKPQEMTIHLQLGIPTSGEQKKLTAVAKPSLQDSGYRIDLEILSAEGEGISLDFATALFEKVVELLDLRSFDFGNFALQLKDLDVQPGKLLLRATTTVEPGTLNDMM